MAASATKFRSCFNILKEKIKWYPGHMNASFKHMQAKIRNVDCVVEVHDSRIPFSGRNPKFLWGLIGPKPHILVLNKKDLIDDLSHESIRTKCEEDDTPNVVFTNCLEQKCKGLKKVIPLAVNLIQKSSLCSIEKSSYKMMVVGVPNVGKSSFINAIRSINLGKGKAAAVGASPGITKKVQKEVKISSEPPIYLIDTPGILAPNIDSVECGMKLALCACIKDSIVGIEAIADFILYWMNKTENFIYIDYFGLSQPTDDIFPVLLKIALDKKYIRKAKNIVTNSIEEIPDIQLAAEFMIKVFRTGKLGDLGLDKNYLSNLSSSP